MSRRNGDRFAGKDMRQPLRLPAAAENSFMAVTLESLDLAELLCSRVCHDLISPAGAIVNGLEVLDEAKDEETKSFALSLIRKSARTATARLQLDRKSTRLNSSH